MSNQKKTILWSAVTLLLLSVLRYASIDHTDTLPPLNKVSKAEAVIEQKLSVKLLPEPLQKKAAEQKAQKPTPQCKVSDDVEAQGQYLRTSLDYRRTCGFDRYWRVMQRIGGRFFLYDRNINRITAEIDLATETLHSARRLEGLSARSRIITGELATDRLEEVGRSTYGPGSYQVILLLPRHIENHIQSSIRQELANAGFDLSTVVEIKGQYQVDGQDVRMAFDRIVLTGSRTKEIKFTIDV